MRRIAACLLATLALAACDRRSPDATTPGSSRAEAAAVPPASAPAFDSLPAFDFMHDNGAAGGYAMPEILGAGVGLLDYDGDGDLDLLAVQSGALERSGTDVPVRHRLFENRLVQTGELALVDVSGTAGIETRGYGMGVAVGDIDNDGDPDVYVTADGDNALFRNEGDGRFVDVTSAAGVNDPRWSTSASFCDVDGDGLLDLYVANYLYFSARTKKRCNDAAGREDYCTPEAYPPVPDALFINRGEGVFEPAASAWGIDRAFGPGLGVLCADLNGDGHQDLYVANDGQANQLWLNRAGRGFEDAAVASGAAYNMDGLAEASMGVTAGDFDGDGDEDLFMTHLDSETNTIYRNDGEIGFIDVTDQVRLGFASMAFTGFGTGWFDVENDGDLDLVVANGAVKRASSATGTDHSAYAQGNQLFVNEDGRFAERSELLGDEHARREVSRGIAFGDLDNDGDTDLVISNNDGPVRLLLNRGDPSSRYVGLTLRGVESNADAAGARVAVTDADGRTLWRRVHRDGSYLSASDPRLVVGLGPADGPVTVEVLWPSGRSERWAGLAVGREHTLREGGGTPSSSP